MRFRAVRLLVRVNEPVIGSDSPDQCPVGVDSSACSANRLGHGTLSGSLVPRGTQVLQGPKGTDTSIFGVLVFISTTTLKPSLNGSITYLQRALCTLCCLVTLLR